VHVSCHVLAGVRYKDILFVNVQCAIDRHLSQNIAALIQKHFS